MLDVLVEMLCNCNSMAIAKIILGKFNLVLWVNFCHFFLFSYHDSYPNKNTIPAAIQYIPRRLW